MSKLKIGVIIGSTRDARVGPVPAQWIADLASLRDDFDVELVDLKDFNLPFFNEIASTAWAPSQDPAAIAWQQKIADFDGYIAVVAEYNRALTASMKNAFDQAFVEWSRKPIAFLGYGGQGGAWAVANGRTVATELKMVPVPASVHICGQDYVKLAHQRRPMTEIEEHYLSGVKIMLDELLWWGWTTKSGRDQIPLPK